MVYRRNESFRYKFNKPIQCQFKITRIDDQIINSDLGAGQILDISPTGIKLLSPLNMTPQNKEIEIEIHFSLDDQTFELPGLLLWQKKDFNNEFSYGVKLEITAEIEHQVVEQLKDHARNSPHTHPYP